MPTAGTARSFTGAHSTTGYDVSARRADNRKSDKGSSMSMNKRSNRRGGRK